MQNLPKASAALLVGMFAVAITYTASAGSYQYHTYDYSEPISGKTKTYRLALPAEVTTVKGILVVANCAGGDSRTWYLNGSAYQVFLHLHDGLHELFDKIAEEVESYVDMIAERAVQLGGIAEGTARVAAVRSRLEEYPLAVADGLAHVEAVARALSTFGREARMSIDETDALDDADTADMFTEISRGIDKWLWFVEAHTQAAK
jgi:DNA-binding ferritin-like protein